jgi:hypothetical protein
MKRTLLTAVALLGLMTVAHAGNRTHAPVPYHKLSCDQIASRIQALNVPIGSANNTWDNLRRNPTALYLLLGIKNKNTDYDAMLDQARSERVALIRVAVEKDCAAQRLIR